MRKRFFSDRLPVARLCFAFRDSSWESRDIALLFRYLCLLEKFTPYFFYICAAFAGIVTGESRGETVRSASMRRAVHRRRPAVFSIRSFIINPSPFVQQTLCISAVICQYRLYTPKLSAVPVRSPSAAPTFTIFTIRPDHAALVFVCRIIFQHKCRESPHAHNIWRVVRVLRSPAPSSHAGSRPRIVQAAAAFEEMRAGIVPLHDSVYVGLSYCPPRSAAPCQEAVFPGIRMPASSNNHSRRRLDPSSRPRQTRVVHVFRIRPVFNIACSDAPVSIISFSTLSCIDSAPDPTARRTAPPSPRLPLERDLVDPEDPRERGLGCRRLLYVDRMICPVPVRRTSRLPSTRP